MDKEELKSKVDEVLGSTQLSLSERTISEELEDALSDVTDDSMVDEKFVTRIANRLKRMSGNLHADVGAESKRYRENFEKEWKEKHPETKPEEKKDKSELEKKIDELYQKFTDADNERKEQAAKAKKETAFKEIKEGLDELFEKANVKPNSYILRQTLKEIEVSDDTDVDKAVKKAEKAYYKNLKEAGLDTEGKPGGGNAFVADKKMSDDLWAKKAKKEGWKTK